MSTFATFSARLLIAATLLATAAAPAAAKPWDDKGGDVYVKAPAGLSSPVVLTESFKTALTKSKVTVTPRSGATATGDGTLSLPVSRVDWFTTTWEERLLGGLHRGVIEFKGKNGLRVGLGNLRPIASAGYADLYVNGTRIAGGLPFLLCNPLTGADVDAYAAALPDQAAGVECPLRLSSLATSLLNGLTGTSAFGRGTLAYVAVVPGGYDNPALRPVRPGVGTN